ncbi:hypothetical protein [Winogradskyella sp. MH6]|uniref:hypothetical protein n=1 Tax=Winogradskyella sp. MH6 TaxID=2929510 RepID=UPI001FB29448|nr:hypothetical protein [Winogradskyella sp. MH6]
MSEKLDIRSADESFYAVNSFLGSGGKHLSERNIFTCSFKVNHTDITQRFNSEVEIECKEFVPAYIFYSNAFKSLGYFHPVWSSYCLFSWDEIKEELSVTLNDKTIVLKHI